MAASLQMHTDDRPLIYYYLMENANGNNMCLYWYVVKIYFGFGDCVMEMWFMLY